MNDDIRMTDNEEPVIQSNNKLIGNESIQSENSEEVLKELADREQKINQREAYVTQKEEEVAQRESATIQKEKDLDAVCILSKGVWGNEDLIKNIPVPLTLEYFEAAINYLGQLINEVKKDKKKAKDITMCLEFVLCVFRLRSYKDEGLNKLLSLNNKYVKKLYKYVESLIENKIEIHSFLSLEIKNKGVYEDVPDILYALLLFITGAEGAGDIRIAGLSLDDLTT